MSINTSKEISETMCCVENCSQAEGRHMVRPLVFCSRPAKQDVFAAYDVNNDGKLSREEMAPPMWSLWDFGIGVLREEVASRTFWNLFWD